MVRVANNGIIQSTEKGTLRVPTFTGSDIVITGYIFPDHTLSHNLAGFSNFCNEGCTVTLTQIGITVSRDGVTIWAGEKAPNDKLWFLDLSSIGTPTLHPADTATTDAMSAIHLDSDAEYVRFVHAALGSPPLTTFLKAISNGWLSNLPRLTTLMVRRNAPDMRNCAMGHLDTTRQGLNSTRRTTAASAATYPDADDDTSELDQDDPGTLRFYIKPTSEWINASDATGGFNCPSASRWKYILVSVMNNYVHLELLRDRTKAEYLRAYKSMYAFYADKGKTPTLQILDNETSGVLATFLQRTAKADIQYVPPANHRANKAERAIRPTKNCIISMLTTTDPKFPAMLLFDEVTTQAEIVINLLRPWHPHGHMNAWTGMHGRPYDHMRHPISIYGIKVVIHDKPAVSGSWATHGVDGFYLAPALQHYRCWRTYALETESTRITDTVEWLPEPFLMPGHTPLEALSAALRDMQGPIDNATSTEKRLLSSPSPTQRQNLAIVDSLRNLFQPSSLPPPRTADERVLSPVTTPPTEQRVEPTVTPPEDMAVPPHSPPDQRVVTPPTSQITPDDNIDAIIAEHQHIMDQSPQLPSSQYRWRRAATAIKGRPNQQRYYHKIDELFTDDTGTQRIVGIDINAAVSKGVGSKTLFYKYYSVSDHMTPPTNKNDYEHIPCAELLRDKTVEWTSIAHLAMAMQASVLNLNSDGTPLTFNRAMQGDFQAEWDHANDQEIRKLLTATETMRLIHKADIPADRRGDITYYNPQVKEKIKEGEHLRRVRGTAGGNLINYPGPVTARTASLEVVRTMYNSALHRKANLCNADITDYYLGTPMDRPEYLRMTRKQLSPTIIAEYDMEQYFHNDVVHFEVNKGMYGLPQAGLLAQQRLIKHLAAHGYTQSDIVPCLFRHQDNGVTFVLVVDDFGIMHETIAGRDHLLKTLRLKYKITVDEDGEHYLGMTVKHDKVANTITLSMPGYIRKVLARFKDWLGSQTAASPGVYKAPSYGAKVQKPVHDDTMPLSPADKTTLQEVVGSILYYARAVDPTMLTICNTISSEQANPTEAVKAQAVRLLQYAARYPDNELVFHESKMQLILQADASFNSRSKGRSVAGGIAYCGDADNPTAENGMIHSISSIIDVVCASVGEAEYGAAYMLAQYGVGLRHILIALGHPQPPTPLLCDNEFAIGLANDAIKIKKSKSIDLRFHWIRDRIRQGQFSMIHIPGKQILADFFTKTLSVADHQAMMPRLVHTPAHTSALGGWQRVTKRHRR